MYKIIRPLQMFGIFQCFDRRWYYCPVFNITTSSAGLQVEITSYVVYVKRRLLFHNIPFS